MLYVVVVYHLLRYAAAADTQWMMRATAGHCEDILFSTCCVLEASLVLLYLNEMKVHPTTT